MYNLAQRVKIMSLVKYEIVNKVAEVHSFTKAADELGLTQSAIATRFLA